MKNQKTNTVLLWGMGLLMVLLVFSCSSSSDDAVQTDDGSTNTDSVPEMPSVLNDTKNLGVNFNEQLAYIDNDRLLALKTKWVRGFVDFFQFYENPSRFDSDEGINKYLGLKIYDFNTVLNLKFNFRGKDFPADNSAEMNNQMGFLKKLLDKVWDKTDIIVVGNEPFIETDGEDQNEGMYNYYVAVCKRVKEYADAHGQKPIFFGAFDNMYQSRRQNLKVLNDLLSFSKKTSWIKGVDMHIHHAAMNEMRAAMVYVSERIRNDQKILVSEFSLMKYFRNNLNGTIPSTFANKYDLSPSWKNYQYLDYALKNQVQRKEWVDFLSESPWFESRKNYLSNSFNDVFSSYDQFFLATYAFRQSYPLTKDFTNTTDPWILNGLYANRTVEKDAGGHFQFNYAWAKDFISIQNNK